MRYSGYITIATPGGRYYEWDAVVIVADSASAAILLLEAYVRQWDTEARIVCLGFEVMGPTDPLADVAADAAGVYVASELREVVSYQPTPGPLSRATSWFRRKLCRSATTDGEQ